MQLLFALTAGRTGSAFLAELLARNIKHAQVHHEQLRYDEIGVDSPDLSDMVLFNSRGNVKKVRRFWDRKLDRVLACGAQTYVETAHTLMKGGLVENAVRRCAGTSHELHLIRLRRALLPTLLSYDRRGDFLNKSSQWVWYLDDGYPRRFVEPEKFRPLGPHGLALWYLLEVEFRAEYYKQRYGAAPGVTFHEVDLEELSRRDEAARLLSALTHENVAPDDVDLPGKVNASPQEVPPPSPETMATLERLVAAAEALNPAEAARCYVEEQVDPFEAEERSDDPWGS